MPKTCPRCETDLHSSKAEACPNCGVRLARFDTVTRRTTPPKPFTQFIKRDKGLWSLLLVNLLTIAIAVYEQWQLPFAMTVYAAQSLLIGIGMVVRIRNLNQFSTAGFKINEKPVKEEPATRGKVALFFTIHYGMFHGFYLLFLGIQYDLSALPLLTVLLCTCAFAVQQWGSVKDDIAEDQDRRPNIGTLMFLPYARVVPMHLMIILGGWFAGSMLGVLAFLLLKLFADLLMYVVELYALYPKAEGFRRLSKFEKKA